MCYIHKHPLKYYCETCEEPICNQCLYQYCRGTHGQQHRATNIEDAYRIRVAKLSQIINSSLLLKRDELKTQINSIDHRLEEISYAKEEIERDARVEYG